MDLIKVIVYVYMNDLSFGHELDLFEQVIEFIFSEPIK